ncbi:hypothetical protein UFOVP901_31 [uncultured Caudovirales phage]|uniref:Phage tail tape measure protein n=1 Tax=uncultured Caudovirales phage TaxID=2100421 RepID=A0A6J5PG64_9CAUD|nr:hypothetical protein UFOVP901_31 [uncultured Caudovirales phage]
MAKTQEDLLIKIQADTANSSEAIALLVKQLGRLENSLASVSNSSEQTSRKISGFGAAMVAISAGISVVREAYDKVEGTITATLGAFQDSEDGLIRLGNTMRVVGDSDIQKSIDAFKELAHAMQETTTVEDGQVIKLANIAKATGLSTDKTMELIKASADLAATGKSDLTGAFNALLKSLKGSTMGLSVMLPELANMTKESARAGGAISFVRETLGGLAENELLTTGGQLLQANSRLHDLGKNIGEVASTLLGLKTGTSSFNAILGTLVEAFNRNKDSILGFAKAVHDGFITFVDGIKSLYAGLNAVDWERTATLIAAVGVSLGGAFLLLNVGALSAGLLSVAGAIGAVGMAAFAAAPRILLMAKAWTANAAAMAYVTVQYALVAAGIATVVVAISLVIKNLKELPALAAASFQAVAIGAGTAVEAMLRFVGAGAKADSVAAGVDKIGESFAKNASVLDGGLVGGGIDELNKFKNAFEKTLNVVTGSEAKTEDNKGKKKTELKIYSPEAIKAADELIAKNRELYNEIHAGEMTAQQLMSDKQKIEIEALNLKYKDMELNAAGNDALREQIKLINEKYAAASKKLPSVEFQAAAKSGNDLAASISGAMTGGLSGVGGMITGMMSGAGAVMAAADGVVGSIQGVIDFIPKILNSVANVFSSLADLPLKILDGVKNLMGSLVKVVTDLIPNLFSAVPDILFSIIDTIFSKLPAAIMNLVKSLPDLIMGFIDRIPEIVTELISGLISAVPTLVISLATSIIGNIPKIVIALSKAAAITIPKAIIKGIMDGLKSIGAAIASMFGGGLFGKKKQKLEFDTKSITESMKKAASALTGETSKLFKVMDLTGGDTKSAEKTKENISAIEAAGTRSRDWLMQAWDKVVAGFGNLMTWFGEVWHVFLRALQSVFSGIMEMFTALFDGVIIIFSGIATGLFEVMNGLGVIIEGFAQGIEDGLAGLGTFFNDLGGQISEGFWEGLQGLGAFFTNMFDSLKLGNLFEKLFKVDYKGRGYIEQNVINTDIPFMNFAKGGMVPGNAQVTGDSLMNDRVLAMISPGEAIIPRSKMNDPFLSGLIRGVLDGTITPPKFKMGGVVGSVVEKTKETGGQVADAAQVAAQQVQDLIASLNPSQITAMVREKILKEMIPAMLSANKFHTGGIIGGSGDVPILGQAGEFVMQRSAVNGIGSGTLAQMNKTGSSSVQGNTSNVYNIDIKVDAKTAPDEKFIRGTMVPIIKEELRRASLDGQRVLFQQGIRA